MDSALHIMSGRLFQAVGPANAKARLLVLHCSRIMLLLDIFVCFVMLGEMLNVHDAYAHPNFFSGIDEMTGFKTR